MRAFHVLCFLISLTVSQAMANSVVKLSPEKGSTEFVAIGRPSALRINGTGQGPAGSLDFKKSEDGVYVSGSLSVDMTSWKTGIGMRDTHMKDKYLEVEKFKHATLTLKDAKLPAAALSAGGEFHVAGQLNLHGQDKSVEVTLNLKPEGETINSSSRFKVKLSDYGIDVPKFSGITVADEVEITTSTQAGRAELKEVL